jgi:nucleoside-diphosphate-sugar epimerase
MNMGNPVEIPLIEMAGRIIALTGSRSRIVHRRLPEDDPKVRQPDISLARRVLHWEPKVTLDRGLRKTITYFRKRISEDRG